MREQKRTLFLSVALSFVISIGLGSCLPHPTTFFAPLPAGVSHIDSANLPLQLEGISWCPDGDCIVIGGHETSGDYALYGGIYALDVTNGDLVTLVERRHGLQIHPTCSPHGNQVAFYSDLSERGSRGWEGIWTVEIGDSNQPQFLIEGDHPTWSPNGRQMAFARHQGEYRNWTDTIYILDLETGDTTEVFTANAELIDFGGLAWSPDGEQLAFSFGEGPLASHVVSETNIYVLDLERDELFQLTSEGRDDHPSWSPDGHMIAYTNGPTYSQKTIVIAKADGTCSVKPLEMLGLDWAAWSPDGAQIAFTWEHGVYVMDVATVLGDDFLTTGPTCP